MVFANPHTLMVQGTTSDAGKSILVTAFCRMLARKKISVAPFKPQNMALNSAVTAEGGEIGRAQAVQADACYLSPSILMNPVLLKPNSDLGSQVIVNGRAIGNMKAQEYHRFKPELLNTVVASHQALAQQYSAIIVEGAGSPAEINLRDSDIANMGFAEVIDCPVIIAADIDRGGVFAHLYGTYELLSDSEQRRIVGFVINRFRGDVSLLEPGLEWLEQKTGVPVLAVVPYIPDLHIEAEDSISQSQLGSRDGDRGEHTQLKVVIPTYPRASNHTDFDVLRLHPQVDCQFMKTSDQFCGADLIVLPGSKNVRGDLEWLRASGWLPVIERHLRFGGKVLGICGGFQMLGKWIHDPEAIEAQAGSSEGLGLLSMETTLTDNKMLRNVSGYLVDSKIPVSGYEIHAGISRGDALAEPLFNIVSIEGGDGDHPQSSFRDGAVNADENVAGTYIHGVFDEPLLLAYWLQWAGLTATENFDYTQFKDAQIDRLADEVEKAFPLAALTKLLQLDVQ